MSEHTYRFLDTVKGLKRINNEVILKHAISRIHDLINSNKLDFKRDISGMILYLSYKKRDELINEVERLYELCDTRLILDEIDRLVRDDLKYALILRIDRLSDDELTKILVNNKVKMIANLPRTDGSEQQDRLLHFLNSFAGAPNLDKFRSILNLLKPEEVNALKNIFWL